MSAVPTTAISESAQGNLRARVRILAVDSQRQADRSVAHLRRGLFDSTPEDLVRRELVQVRTEETRDDTIIVVEWTAN